jgi:NAD(P)-dependent dehydrogenase (short-subunit alcohol dehydrogenase family)
MTIHFPEPYRALVIGTSGAIGQAFSRYLKEQPHCGEVVGLSRSSGADFDLQDPQSIERLGKSLKAAGPFHLIIDSTGALTMDGIGPEKSLSRLDYDLLLRSFAVNAVGPAMLLRALVPLLASDDTIYAKLSARVGSISDNRQGGWYGYRASKAALNMMLQTAAIELQRKNPKLRVVALQPGTVRSQLSAPFQAGVPHLLEPSESVAGMMRAMMALEPKSGAYFVDYQGQEILW